MFEQIEKTEQTMQQILLATINKNNMEVFNQIYQCMEENNFSYYSSVQNVNENKIIFNTKMFKHAVDNTNIGAIEFYINNNINWKYINTTPSIYYALSNNNIIAFNYLYSFYEKLTKQEILAINGIKILNIISLTPNYYYRHNNSVKLNYVDCLIKIFKLPIEFEDMSILIASICKHICKISLYNINKQLFKYWDEFLNLMYIIFKSNNVKSNPFIHINDFITNTNEITILCNYALKKINIPSYKMCLDYIKKIKYLFDYFNWEPLNEIKKTFDIIFINEDKQLYEINKQIFIEQLANYKITKTTTKPKDSKNKNIII